MSKTGFVKLSEEELIKQIAQYEKREHNLKYYGVVGAVIGVIGSIISIAVGLLEDRSLRNLDEIRSRFKDSLTPMGNMIDVLRDSCGKI